MKYPFPTFETYIQIYIFQKLILFTVIFTAAASFVIASCVTETAEIKKIRKEKLIGSLFVLLYQYSRLD